MLGDRRCVDTAAEERVPERAEHAALRVDRQHAERVDARGESLTDRMLGLAALEPG
jgi:hypothetical protein